VVSAARFGYGRRMWLIVSAVSGALAVAFGAFGAHALKSRLSADALAVWHTAVLYHLVHSAVLAALALSGRSVALPSALLAAGIVLFSGSLYVLSLSGLRWLGAITPLGGLCFIAGWLAIALLARGQ
jgi:uncharacterized membrane protein YgdD (TMEM256/DUF423 family)